MRQCGVKWQWGCPQRHCFGEATPEMDWREESAQRGEEEVRNMIARCGRIVPDEFYATPFDYWDWIAPKPNGAD